MNTVTISSDLVDKISAAINTEAKKRLKKGKKFEQLYNDLFEAEETCNNVLTLGLSDLYGAVYLMTKFCVPRKLKAGDLSIHNFSVGACIDLSFSLKLFVKDFDDDAEFIGLVDAVKTAITDRKPLQIQIGSEDAEDAEDGEAEEDAEDAEEEAEEEEAEEEGEEEADE